MDPLDLLVVAPHPDDAELGIGGTIIRARKNGLRVGIVDLTSGEPTPHGSLEIRRTETQAATEILGVQYRENLNLPNRSLVASLEARRDLAIVFRKTRPRLILAPYWEDAHPDHLATTELAEGARFWAKLTKTDMPGEPFHPPKIMYYFCVHLRIHPKPAVVLDISDEIDEKMASVRAYQSQFVTGRSNQYPTFLDDVRDRARYWGWSIGTSFAEPLASREELGLNNIGPLLPPGP